MHPYLPHTSEDLREMLKVVGVETLEDLYGDVPEELLLKHDLDLPHSHSEIEVRNAISALAGKNKSTDDLVCFLGAGAYDHYIPAAVNALASRSEFYTAYTPYQPEISQGTLQIMFEYQTMIANLTGMEISNASLYDGGSAAAEAAFLAAGHTRRSTILVSKTVHPATRKVLRTYTDAKNYKLVEVDMADGTTDLDALAGLMTKEVATFIVQSPNFFGLIEDVPAIAELVHAQKALLIQSADPLSLALLKSPGEMGADIVVGDAQVLGLPLNYGGPYLGYITVNKELVRKIPGRLSGQTVDKDGKRGFVLTLQAREQHIRRQRATSNITSNQALMATRAAIYLSLMGKEGLKEVATQTAQKAHYAAKALTESGKYKLRFNKPFFREFVLDTPGNVESLNEHLLSKGILGGYDLGQDYPEFAGATMLSVTEKRTREEIDKLVKEMEAYHV